MSTDIQLESQANSSDATVVLTPATTRDLLLKDLLRSGVLPADVWQGLDAATRRHLSEAATKEELLVWLVEAGLLTSYQAAQIRSEGANSLIIGNYRVLDKIGSGGMGIVYRGDHLLLRRPVAIKVLRTGDVEEILVQRFFGEVRALARIRHPHIAWALDAGTVRSNRLDQPNCHYLVMELIAGESLETVAARTPLSVSQACELVYQIAGALDATYKLNLIHRDIKPSNILVTPQGKAKLLDFGLALHFGQRRLTMPGTVLGTLAYMAPEQVSDAASVDIRADIFGLGATLFFCLTGVCPFPAYGHVAQQAASRLQEQVPDVRAHRQDVSPELDAVIRRMMSHEREDRYPTPQSLLRALLPFVNSASMRTQEHAEPSAPSDHGQVVSAVPATPRVLLVDDEEDIRRVCRAYLRRENMQCNEAGDGVEALRMLEERPYDLVVLDIDMPRMTGAETLDRLRRQTSCGHVKVIMMSGGVTPDEMARMLAMGANDFVAKPLTRLHFVARVKAALAHKATLDRSDALNQQLLQVNADLERALAARSSDLSHVRKALLYALARIVESRTQETAGHLTRMSRFAGAIARQGRAIPHLASALDDTFVQTLETCTPLHDIGNVAMPDHILRRTVPLSAEDRIIMQAHTTIGAETLGSVAKKDRSAAAFWQMAIDISRHHHERHDGSGYPDGLSGRDIPLAARIVAIADVYENLRAPGELGVALSHNAAIEMIVEGSKGRFDPLLVNMFQQIEADIDEIYRALPD